MSKKAHFNPKSFTWLISLAVMIVLCVGVIVGSRAIFNLANAKYDKPVEIDFTISSTKDIDVSSMNTADFNVTSVQEGVDASGKTVAYVVKGTAVGYNADVPIETETVISADGQLVCSVQVLKQEETEYLGVRIAEPTFTDQFKGRIFPLKARGDSTQGSPIDLIAGSTISSKAVMEAVNNAQGFVVANLAQPEAQQ